MKYIGAHVSIEGGVENAPLRAHELGATAFAMFTKNQKQWRAAPLKPESIAAFKENCARLGYGPERILPHDGYLINLGNPDPEKRKISLESFLGELRRCRDLGLDRLNFHPGSSLKEITVEECLSKIAEGLRIAVDEVPEVTPVIENTAGQGSNVGWKFEELAALIDKTGRPDRLGVCIDTCHAFAAGYDWVRDYDGVWTQFDRLIGFGLLRGMHLNDAKADVGSHLDRHHSLGAGFIGWGVFEKLMRDPRLDGIPLTLETIDETLWSAEIARLRNWADAKQE